MTEAADQDFVTIRQAAEALGLSERSIRRHVRHLSGTVPAAVRQESGRSPARVRMDALIERVEEARAQAMTPAPIPAAVRQESGRSPVPDEAALLSRVTELEAQLASKEVEISALRARVEGQNARIEQFCRTESLLSEQVNERTRGESELRRLLLQSMLALPTVPDTAPSMTADESTEHGTGTPLTGAAQNDKGSTRRGLWPWRRRSNDT